MEGAILFTAGLAVAASVLALWALLSQRQERKERESAQNSAK
jgi:hypothetical protein